MEGQPPIAEGAGLCGEERIHGIDQRRCGAPVGAQHPGLAGGIAGVQVGLQIGAAKAVDGLLRIADKKQGHAFVGKDPLENGVLQRVRILKFVDQRDRKTVAQRLGKHRAALPGQRVVQA